MRTITLTTKEFYRFKELTSFWFDLYIKGGFVFITADDNALAELGY
jgi:hypothetical protein